MTRNDVNKLHNATDVTFGYSNESPKGNTLAWQQIQSEKDINAVEK